MRKNITILTFCLCLILAACGGSQETAPPQTAVTQQPPATPQPALSTCADFERIHIGDYILNNNVWNKGDRTDYTQCIFAHSETPPTTMGWRWDWPGDAREIQAYPEVMIGDSPWDAEPVTGGLPLPVGARDVLVTYTAAISATEQWNMAFEMWLTSDPAPAEHNITDEVMIWVARNDLMPGPLVYDKVTFDGVAYTVHVAPGHGDASGGSAAKWQYIAFVAREPQLSGTLNMSHFLDYLVEKQVIEPDRYIASLELGTEIRSGAGEFILSTYEVTTPTADRASAATPVGQAADANRVTNIPGLPPTYYEATYGKLTYGFYVPENYNPAQSYPLIMHMMPSLLWAQPRCVTRIIRARATRSGIWQPANRRGPSGCLPTPRATPRVPRPPGTLRWHSPVLTPAHCA